MPLRNFMAACRDRLARSRFFTVSLTFHLVLIAFISQQIITRYEPPEVVPTADIVQADPIKAPERETTVVTPNEIYNPATAPSNITPPITPDVMMPGTVDVFRPILTNGESQRVMVDKTGLQPVEITPKGSEHRLTAGELKVIGRFADWRKPGGNDRFVFTAFIGKYQGGNWASTVRLNNGQITAGSLPNLLYAMSKWTNDRIETNERNVKAIALDSDELLTARPPFIFLTGTRDFKLTEREVENLRNYIRCGGAVWGDASVPGERSAFDLAFRREMQRVMGEQASFEPLPANHAVFTNGYFSKVKQLPAGINNYQAPVKVMRWGGEIAVIFTTNDYGDMWQVGLDKDGRIDLSRNASGQYVAMNPTLWEQRGTYVRNIDQPAVEQAYRFGINMVVHLLTRWESKVRSGVTL